MELRPAEKRHSRADGQVCPSALLPMVLRPAGSPYETSTNRRGVRVGGHCARAGCGRGRFVILSVGGEAAGVEGSHWSQAAAAATRRLWLEGHRRPAGGTAPAAGARAAAASGLRRLVQVSCGWPRVGRVLDLRAPAGCGRAGAPSAASPPARLRARGLRKPRRSRVDGQVCPSTLLPMVLRPAGSPYETSTNRQTAGRRHAASVAGSRVAAASTCGDWCGFRAAGCGLAARSTCKRPQVERARHVRLPICAHEKTRFLFKKCGLGTGLRLRMPGWFRRQGCELVKRSRAPSRAGDLGAQGPLRPASRRSVSVPDRTF